MRRDGSDFGDVELELVHLSRRLKDALAVEELLTGDGRDYFLETAPYRARLLFVLPVDRIGVYFWVPPETADACRALLAENGYSVVEVEDDSGDADGD